MSRQPSVTRRRAKTKPIGTIYMYHFDRAIEHSQHYIGFAEAENLEKRGKQHGTLAGAKLMLVAKSRGIEVRLVRTWENKTRDDERKLKNLRNARRHCPECKNAKYEGEKFQREMKKLGVTRKYWKH